jgi:hypothetical protein
VTSLALEQLALWLRLPPPRPAKDERARLAEVRRQVAERPE